MNVPEYEIKVRVIVPAVVCENRHVKRLIYLLLRAMLRNKRKFLKHVQRRSYTMSNLLLEVVFLGVRVSRVFLIFFSPAESVR